MRHFKRSSGFARLMIGLLISSLGATQALAQSGNSACGSLSQGAAGYGPWDYRTDKPKLGIVEQYHFTPAVETLVRGSTNVLPGADLDYTLRAIPNHHRALLAMMRYGEKMKSPQPQGTRYPVECYFDRAVRFRPDDAIVRMLYARFLAKNERMPEANQQLESATVAAADNGFSHYNIGLIYFDLKEYDKALLQAHKAISLGFPQTALRDQLQSVGKWTEPADLPVTPTADNAPAEQPK
ncbi:MAG: tetratricopeptide repeat protein [Polaromonas sp.]